MNKPTDAAIKLARTLIKEFGFHDEDQLVSRIARDIDSQLLLPEKHAALLLAQALIDSESWKGCDPSTFAPDLVDQLRTALSKIR